MKKAVFLIILILVAGAVFGQEFTFRGLPWGSSINDVIKKEGKPTYSDKNGDESTLLYKNVSIAGTTADLRFTFSKNHLIGAEYEIWCPDVRDPQKLYQPIALNLKSLYGRPIEERYIPKGTIQGGIHEYTNDIWSYSWVFQRTHIIFIYQIGDDGLSGGSIKYESQKMSVFDGL